MPTDAGVEIFDGPTGRLLGTLSGGSGQNSPLVTEDANGTIGVTVAGGDEITHYEIAGSNGSTVNGVGAWPMFHHDPQLTGLVASPPPDHRGSVQGPGGDGLRLLPRGV